MTGRPDSCNILSVFPAFFLASALFLRPLSTLNVAIRPLGPVDPDVLARVAEHLRATCVADVTVLPPEELPGEAYYPPRHRYRGDTILDFLNRDTPSRFSHVIGITQRDISVTSGDVFDWGVLGVSQLSGRPGIVSTYRLRARDASGDRVQKRLDNVVLHELGHTLGLPHCTHKGCVMQDAHGSILPVDESTGQFCSSCAARLLALLR